jgi:4-hydroxymandelate synthase
VSAPNLDRQDAAVVTARSAAGDVLHRLVERRGPGGSCRARSRCSRRRPGPTTNAAEIDHLAVCVPPGQLAETVRQYREVFGFMRSSRYIEVAGRAMNSTVVQSPSGRVTLVLLDRTRPAGRDRSAPPRPARRCRVQHLGLRRIVGAVNALGRRRVRFAHPGQLLRRPGQVSRVDAPVERLRTWACWSTRIRRTLLQIFTESMHVRRTLFGADRAAGALTFGNGNIKALYEAKERELAAATVPAVTAQGREPTTTGFTTTLTAEGRRCSLRRRRALLRRTRLVPVEEAAHRRRGRRARGGGPPVLRR